MMRNMMMPFATLLLMLATVPAWADGLLYQLPDDGAWALFDSQVKMTRGGQLQDATGQLRMSSVGTATEDGTKCRWFEFQMTVKFGENERLIIAKILIPENRLEAGQKPVENRVRGWIRMGADREVVELTEANLGLIPAFISNPLTEVKKLAAITVNSKLGELSCAGLTGRTEFKESTATNKVAYETRRHEKAPFGVVTSQLTIEVERGGEIAEKLEMNLTLSDSGTTAKSELPDHK